MQNGLMQQVNIFCAENDHLHAFYVPTKNRTNWMRASCQLLCQVHSFGEGCMGLCLVSWPTSLLMIMRICVLYLIIRSEVLPLFMVRSWNNGIHCMSVDVALKLNWCVSVFNHETLLIVAAFYFVWWMTIHLCRYIMKYYILNFSLK